MPRRLTPQWKAAALAELERRGRGSKLRAAEAIGVTPSNLTQMLGPRMKMSEKADALSEFLGIPAPSVDVESAGQERWFKLVQRLQSAATPEVEAELLALVERRIQQMEERRRLSQEEADTLEKLRGPERPKK